MTYMANGQLSAGAAGLPPASRQNIFPNKTLGTEFYFHFLGERWKVNLVSFFLLKLKSSSLAHFFYVHSESLCYLLPLNKSVASYSQFPTYSTEYSSRRGAVIDKINETAS